jgi:hypothetical protein
VGFPSIVLIMIVHLMLGFRRLRDIERYRDDWSCPDFVDMLPLGREG